MHPRVLEALAKIAEAEGTNIDAVTERLVLAQLRQMRDAYVEVARLQQAAEARGVTSQPVGRPGERALISDPCSETHLRQICGDNWEACWWAFGCWIPHY